MSTDRRRPARHPARVAPAGDRSGVPSPSLTHRPSPVSCSAFWLGSRPTQFSHAFVADQLGDHRPRALGRVTSTPCATSIPRDCAALLIGIGWGKPVPVAIEALRPGRIGMAYVAGAGPIANVVVALLLATAFRRSRSGRTRGVGGARVPAGRGSRQPPAGAPEPHPHSAARRIRRSDRRRIPPLEYAIRRYQSFGVVLLLILLILPNSPLSAILGLARPWPRPCAGSERRTGASRPPRPPVPRPPSGPRLARRARGGACPAAPEPRWCSTPCRFTTNATRSTWSPVFGRGSD